MFVNVCACSYLGVWRTIVMNFLSEEARVTGCIGEGEVCIRSFVASCLWRAQRNHFDGSRAVTPALCEPAR